MKLTYAVVKCGEIWKIVGERRRMGTFHVREEAVVAAKRLGREAESGGCEVSLLVQEPSGLLMLCDIHSPVGCPGSEEEPDAGTRVERLSAVTKAA